MIFYFMLTLNFTDYVQLEHPKMKILSLFTQSYAVPDVYDFLQINKDI